MYKRNTYSIYFQCMSLFRQVSVDNRIKGLMSPEMTESAKFHEIQICSKLMLIHNLTKSVIIIVRLSDEELFSVRSLPHLQLYSLSLHVYLVQNLNQTNRNKSTQKQEKILGLPRLGPSGTQTHSGKEPMYQLSKPLDHK